MEKKRIPSLDGVRGIGILCVLIIHALSKIHAGGDQTVTLIAAVSVGYPMMKCFFLISGYLITLLLKKEWERDGRFSLQKFYLRRVLRIFPVFYSFIIVVTLLWAAGLIKTRAPTILSAALYTWNYSFAWLSDTNLHLDVRIDEGSAIFAHFWTLSCEEQFYLLWPLTLYFLGFRKGARVAVAMFLLLPVSRVVTYLFWPEARGQTMIMLHTTADPIMAGCLMAVWQGEAWWEKIKNYLDNGKIAIAATVFVTFISPALQLTVGGKYDLIIGRTLDAVAMVIVILWLIKNANSLVGKIFNSRLIVHFGVISYSLYVWQQIFFLPLGKPWEFTFPLNIIASILVAEICHALIERPFLKLRYRAREVKVAEPASVIIKESSTQQISN